MPPRPESINPTQPPGGNGQLRVQRDSRACKPALPRALPLPPHASPRRRQSDAGLPAPPFRGPTERRAERREGGGSARLPRAQRGAGGRAERVGSGNARVPRPRRGANERDGKSRVCGAGGGSGGGDSVSPLKGARAATWRWERGACLPPPRPRAARGGGQRGARPALAWATRGGGSARRGPARQQPRQRAAARGARGRGPPGGGGGGMARPAETEWQRAEVGAGPRGRAGPSLRWRPSEAKRGAGGPGGAPRARARSLGAAVGAEVGGRALGRRARSLGGSEPSRGGPGPGLPRGGAQCACARPALPAACCAVPRSAGRRRAAPRWLTHPAAGSGGGRGAALGPRRWARNRRRGGGGGGGGWATEGGRRRGADRQGWSACVRVRRWRRCV